MEDVYITDGQRRTIVVCEAAPTALQRDKWALEDFELHKELYRGKSSLLYMATDKASRLLIALKLYRKRKLSTLNRFQVEREVRLHCQLNHPNIIKLYAAFEDEKNVYMVQEFAGNGDLFEHMKRCGGQIKETTTAVDIVLPFLNSLAYLHARNIIHRDIKPENILLASGKMLKLADFGLSINHSAERPVTRAGTLDYMAPEVLSCPDKRHPMDNKDNAKLEYGVGVDAWAAGVLAFELLVGYPPFEKESRASTYDHIMYKDPVYPRWMSDDSVDFISAALTKDASSRPSIAALIAHPWVLRHTSVRRTDQGPTPVPVATTTGAYTSFSGSVSQLQQQTQQRPRTTAGAAAPSTPPVAARARPHTGLNSSVSFHQATSGGGGDGGPLLGKQGKYLSDPSSRNAAMLSATSTPIANDQACGARPSGSAGSARSLLSVGASGSGAGDSLSHSSTLPVVSSSSSGGDSHGHSAAALLGPTKPRSMLGRPAPISISGVPSDLAVLGGVEPVPHGGALSGGDDHSPGISPKAAAAASAGMGRALTPSSSHSPRASCVASASGTQLPPAAPASLSLMQRDGRLQHPHSPLRLAPPALGVLSADPPPVRGAPPSPILRVPSMPALLHHAPAPSRHLSSFSTFSPMRSAGGGTGTGDSAHYGVGGTGSGSDDPPLGSVRQSAHSMRGHERTGPFMRMKSAGGDRDGAAAGGYVQGQQQLQQSRNGLGLPAVDSGISWAGGRDGDAAAAAAAAARRSVGGFAAAGGVFSAAAASAAGAGAGAAIRPTLMRQKSDGPLRAASPGSAGSYGR